MIQQPLQIAIDGPVAAGKGDIATRLAHELHLTYIYTGAMYRALALACIQRGISTKDSKKIIALLSKIKIDLVQPDKGSGYSYKILLDDDNITDQIFASNVAMGSSDVSTIPEVRHFMVNRQKELAMDKAVVMEGRDIGLKVLPDAQLKIFLTATLEERAYRRWLQWEEKGVHKKLADVLHDTDDRDKQDTTRKTDPLQKIQDAWELDTTNLSQSEIVKKIKAELKKRKLL